MTSTVLFTGFPGFLGRRLVRRYAQAHPDKRWVFLVQEKLRQRAEEDLAAISRELPAFAGRWETLACDVTDPLLGVGEEAYRDLAGRVTECWHLAAVYDLAVPEEIARRVNVDGTFHVLDLCQAASAFERLFYISTCYVSGDRTGRVLESELDEGQGFKNHYESTKFWAEVEVQNRWDRVPATIFRPAVVVGDSRTGETDKYDGPYFTIKLMMNLPRLVPMVGIGRGRARLNLVPVDFVIAAMAEIAGQSGSAGKVFQLADPGALRVSELLDLISHQLGKPRPLVSLPGRVLEAALSVDAVRRLLDMPKESIVYANHPVMYDTQNLLDALEGTGVDCPSLPTYLPTLIAYLRENPEKEFLVAHHH